MRAAQLAASGLTIEHTRIDPGAVEISISGVLTQRGREIEAGQCLEAVRGVRHLTVTPGVRARILELWTRWHLNGMRAGCAHQPNTWHCTAAEHAEPVANGWDLFASSGLRYPKSGIDCVACGRARWDEPTDACRAVMPPYRYGTAWLYEPIPAGTVAELRALFSGRAPGSTSR